MDLEFLLYLFIRIELQVEKSPSSLVLYHFVGSESSISADPVVMTRRITAQVSLILFQLKKKMILENFKILSKILLYRGVLKLNW